MKNKIYNENEEKPQDENIETEPRYFTDMDLIAKTLLDRVNLPIS